MHDVLPTNTALRALVAVSSSVGLLTIGCNYFSGIDRKINLRCSPGHYHIMIGVSGSVAAIILNQIVQSIQKLPLKFKICVVFTPNSLYFVADNLSPDVALFTDDDGFPICNNERCFRNLHIALTEWPDLILVCPMSANTMAKVANGLCDNLLTLVLRATATAKPVFFAPAMNNKMYTHPLTKENIDKF